MYAMNFLSWILFGVIVGIIVHALDEDRATISLPGAIAMGITGALAGGIAGSMLFGSSLRGFDLTSFLIAAGGSLFILSLGRAVKRSY